MGLPESEYLDRLRRAAIAIADLEARLDAAERARSEPIAVLGVACRFPGGADTPEGFWRLLAEGRDAVVEIPPARWRPEDVDGPDPPPDQRSPRWAALLDGIDRFDAAFFGVSPREAEVMDPQQRLILEVAWEALERAGQVPAQLDGTRAGVFLGLCTTDFERRCDALGPGPHDPHVVTGNGHSFPAGRLSYLLGLEGPSLVVDTACSSSLVAVHLACQSLRDGESTLAIAGGAGLLLSPAVMRRLARTQALAPDGRCKTFDARADGFARGEGCGVVVLKRLSEAAADGDPILAVILGSAIHQDGRSAALTAPSVRAQEALLRRALAAARRAPEDLTYIEAHGTGTPLGDPIEVEAIARVLGRPRADFGRLIAERIFVEVQRRKNSLVFDSPEQQYLSLIAERPKVIERVPQHMIATYLGISSVHLSRIRRKLSGK